MSVRNDQVNVTVQIDGKQAISNMGKLELSAKDIATELKGMKKGTDEYIAASNRLENVNADIKKLRTEMGAAGMTVQQLRNYQKELNREFINITPGTERYKQLENQLKDVNTKLAQTQKGVKAASDEAKSGGGFMTSFFGNLAANGAQMALSFIENFAAESREAAKETRQANAQLEASLKSTGHAAGLTKNEIDSLAESLQNSVNIDDDVIKQNAAVLLTFTNIKKGIFEQAMPAITDLAAKMDGDLKGATVQVGKALNDPIKGITALTRVGVSFTEEQKKVITTLVETGKTAEAQQLILNELNKEFGGSAKAAAEAEGNIGKFNIKVGELQENLGGGLTNGLDGLAGVGNTVLDFLIEATQETEPLEEVFTNLWDVLKGLWNSFTDLVSAIVPFKTEGSGAATTMKVLATSIEVVISGLKLMAVLVTYGIDNWRVFLDTAKQVSNFFGTKFKLDPTATMANANAKFKTGMLNIAGSYVEIWTDSNKKVEEANAASAQQRLKQEQALTDEQKKEADKRAKDLEKEIDNLIKQWQKLGEEVNKIKDDNYLDGLSKQDREIATTNAHFDKMLDEVSANQKRLLELKLITEDEYTARIQDIETLRSQAVGKIITDGNNAKLTEQQRINGELDTLRLSAQEKEIASTNDYFNKLKTAAQANGLETNRIEEERQISLANITKKYSDAAADAADAARKKEIQEEAKLHQAKISMLSSFASLSAATNSLISDNGAKQNDFQKILTLAQIALNTASSISSVISGATAAAEEGGPAYPFILAGYIASGLAAVFSGMAQAKQALSSANTPAAPEYNGSNSSVTVGSSSNNTTPTPKKSVQAYAAGGFTDIGTVSRGGYVKQPSIATFGEVGEEWVMPNWMLRSPRMANLVGVLEGVRMRGFAAGGFTSTPAPSPGVAQAIPPGEDPTQYMLQLIAEMQGLRRDVREQRAALRAYMVYSDFTDAEDALADIQNEASI